MSNTSTSDVRVCQVIRNGLSTDNVFYYRISPKNQVNNIWFRLPPDIIIVSGTILIHERFNSFQGRFSNQTRPIIQRIEGQDNTYKVSNFSGKLTDAIFDVKVGSILQIDLGQFGLPSCFAQFTL